MLPWQFNFVRHKIFGRKLKRNSKERKTLFKGLISSLILRGRVKTTEAKAKSIKGQIDKIVSKAKKGTLDARRQLLATLNQGAAEKLLNEVIPSFSNRSSGFTQIIKVGPRKGDSAPMVLLQWVGMEATLKKDKKEVDSEKTTSQPEAASGKSEEKVKPRLRVKSKKDGKTQK